MTPTPRLIALPAHLDDVQGVFFRPNDAFIEELADKLRGARVLEIFAGNGYLAARLSKLGVDITATSILSSMDAHCLGVYHPVQNINATEAIERHGAHHDTLLMCWPTVTDSALRACKAWGDKPIAYIGEFTDYAKGHLGGCATDEFFERFSPEHTFASYQGNMLEKACIGRLGQPTPRLAPAPRKLRF